jgi:predicted ferric reductase
VKTIQRSYGAFMALLVVLWLWADPIWRVQMAFFPMRSALINLTGVLGIGVMSAAVILASRPRSLEARLGGLDKMYRLHKWLGITALVVSVLHWLLTQGPKWLVGLGLLQRPQRGPRPPLTDPVAQFFQSQRHLAESVGEWAFYGAALLMVLALIKWFPYRWFFKTHRIIAVAYLALVFHSIILTPLAYWTQGVGVVEAVLLLGGTLGALASLFGLIGRTRQVRGSVEDIQLHQDGQVAQVTVALQPGWQGHRAGQFAFVSFESSEGPHPFTIASDWHGDKQLTFLIKALGDYTRALPKDLKVGTPVHIEGPYGRFNFEDGGAAAHQVWIAGGIGITPFLSKLQSMARGVNASKADRAAVDLIYSTRSADEAFVSRLREAALQAGVRLHLLVEQKDGRLSVDRLCELVPAWREASVWFCGPSGFGRVLREGLTRRGLPGGRFHQELFEMR